MKVDVPLGDVVDKVTILTIKREKIGSSHVEREWSALRASWRNADLPPMEELPQYGRLEAVNRALWEVEDALRRLESEQRFDAHFVESARSVYRLNDERARLKRLINEELSSDFVEEKSYSPTPNTNR